jgi:hypothetical protein
MWRRLRSGVLAASHQFWSSWCHGWFYGSTTSTIPWWAMMGDISAAIPWWCLVGFFFYMAVAQTHELNFYVSEELDVINPTMWSPRWIAKSVQITPITMV